MSIETMCCLSLGWPLFTGLTVLRVCIESICLLHDYRCASYDNVPKTCKMVTDPADSCCLVPSCQPEPQSTPAPVPGVSTPAPTPYQVPTVAPGQVTGSANIPTPKAGMTPPPLSMLLSRYNLLPYILIV